MAKKYGTPGPRMIYPESLRSEQIRELAKNPLHLLVWYTLFHGVDDQGRMEARVSTIQTLCLGHLPEDAIKPRVVQEAIARMRAIADADGVPLLYVYEANGTHILQIARWWAYQGGMRHSWPSRWAPMPGWVDEIRGHGRAALKGIIEDDRLNGDTGEPSAGGLSGDGGETPGHTRGRAQALNQNQKLSVPNGTPDQPKPWDLFAAYLEERALSVADYPGHRIQLRHAKLMLTDGFTIDEVRAATRAFMEDEYHSRVGFDLASIRANWGKMKLAQPAKPKARAPRPLTE